MGSKACRYEACDNVICPRAGEQSSTSSAAAAEGVEPLVDQLMNMSPPNASSSALSGPVHSHSHPSKECDAASPRSKSDSPTCLICLEDLRHGHHLFESLNLLPQNPALAGADPRIANISSADRIDGRLLVGREDAHEAEAAWQRQRIVLPRCAHSLFCLGCIIKWQATTSSKSRSDDEAHQHSAKCPLCTREIGPYVLYDIRGAEEYSRYWFFVKQQDEEERARPPRLRAPASVSRYSVSSVRPPPVQRRRRLAQQSWGGTSQTPESILERGIERRKNVYEMNVWALHMGANKKSAFGPPPSPSQINESGNHQRRLRAWLEREFQALPMTGLSFGSGRGSKSLHSAPSASLDRGTTSADHSFLCTYTLAILCSVPAKSDEAIRLLSEFLGMQRAQHFLHETNAFMRSARDVAKYDVVVRYALAGVVCGLSELRVDKRTCQVGKVLLHPLPVVLRATDGGFLGDTQHLTSGDIKGKRRRVDPEDEAACCTLGMEHEPPFVQSRCRTHSREGALRRCSSTDPPPTMFKELLAWDVCMPESSRQANSQTIMRKAPSSSSRQPVPDVDVDERQAALLVELHSKEAPRNLSKHDIGARREMLLKRLMRERALGLQSWRDKGPVDLGQPSRGSSGDASAVRLSASAGLHDETSVTWPPLVPSESAKFHEPQLSSGSSMDGAAHQDFSATNSSDAARASPSGNLDRLDLEQALGKRASEARLRHVLLSRQRSVSLS